MIIPVYAKASLAGIATAAKFFSTSMDVIIVETAFARTDGVDSC